MANKGGTSEDGAEYTNEELLRIGGDRSSPMRLMARELYIMRTTKGMGTQEMCKAAGFEHLSMDAVRSWLAVEHHRAMTVTGDIHRAHYITAAQNDEPGELEALLHDRPSPGLQRPDEPLRRGAIEV